jgi:hypothetical protein
MPSLPVLDAFSAYPHEYITTYRKSGWENKYFPFSRLFYAMHEIVLEKVALEFQLRGLERWTSLLNVGRCVLCHQKHIPIKNIRVSQISIW